ncbi:PREDICTED: uncharacterized protein LOC109161671 [Ipomoea nil]|uniref:uncharacterized protein LOC109161671 n=1 Tax=Ipomoea nil TaxID=35883 RepID=UPI0009013736|nr:PREDICTED: uncharacterized protein LOC109161671 [Ipomoea nil]
MHIDNLGIEALRTSEGLNLCQRKYTLEILKEYGFLDAKPVHTPFNTGQRLSSLEGELLDKPETFRRLVGRLLYLTNTRPDISFVVQQLSQHVDKPRNTHMMAAHRVLRYLKGSPGKGLFYPSNCHAKLQGFSDSDWASCIETRKSITGYCVYLGQSLISWKTKKQTTVSRSSLEAEYRALASTTCEVQWLLFLLADLQVTFDSPIALFCDNRSAVAIGENHVFHERCRSLLMQSNAVHSLQPADEQSVVAVSTLNNKKKFTNNGGKNVPKCTYCDKLGHTAEKYYRKHGYPPGWIPGYKSKDKTTPYD